jgi:N-hydroxyarylamine O-acetyltransferase
MSSSPSWIDSYFKRIGYTGGREVSYETLSGIQSSHLFSVPFENLDVFLGKDISLNQNDLINKMVYGKRGGVCTEQNTLLYSVLASLGFNVFRLLSRFYPFPVRGSKIGNIHSTIKVLLNNKQYIVDVGSGSFSPVTPLEIGYEGTLTSPYSSPRRIISGENDLFKYQTILRGKWIDIYTFNLEEVPHIDWEVTLWHSISYPTAKYTSIMAVERMKKDKILTFKDNTLRTKFYNGGSTSKPITTPEKLIEILNHDFEMDFPPDTKFERNGNYWPRESGVDLQFL